MPLLDITNPDVIKFLIESYDKTTRLRMKWNRVHAEKLHQAAALNRSETGHFETDVLKNTMVAGMETITRGHKVASFNRRKTPIRDGVHILALADMKKGHSIPEVGLGDPNDDPMLSRPDTDLSIDPIMRPVDSKQKQIIYDGIPKCGRLVYLKSRNKIMPEKKYYFMESSGWEYGWRLKDSFFGSNGTRCGRVWRLTRDVKSRTGPHPDPSHYKSSDAPGPSKCLN